MNELEQLKEKNAKLLVLVNKAEDILFTTDKQEEIRLTTRFLVSLAEYRSNLPTKHHEKIN